MSRDWAKSPTQWGTAAKPRGWKRIRARVLRRDGYRCTWIEGAPHGGWPLDEQGLIAVNTPYAETSPYRCPSPGEEVDHAGRPADHRLPVLRSLCSYHHRKRTSSQGWHAREAAKPKHAKPQHPGLLP